MWEISVLGELNPLDSSGEELGACPGAPCRILAILLNPIIFIVGLISFCVGWKQVAAEVHMNCKEDVDDDSNGPCTARSDFDGRDGGSTFR